MTQKKTPEQLKAEGLVAVAAFIGILQILLAKVVFKVALITSAVWTIWNLLGLHNVFSAQPFTFWEALAVSVLGYLVNIVFLKRKRSKSNG